MTKLWGDAKPGLVPVWCCYTTNRWHQMFVRMRGYLALVHTVLTPIYPESSSARTYGIDLTKRNLFHKDRLASCVQGSGYRACLLHWLACVARLCMVCWAQGKLDVAGHIKRKDKSGRKTSDKHFHTLASYQHAAIHPSQTLHPIT